jgi:hypothetical protein
MYNTLNWPPYNTETLSFLNNNPNTQVTIATDTLSVGINGPAQTAVILIRGNSTKNRPHSETRWPRYLPRGSVKAAQAVVYTNSKGQLWQTEPPAEQPNLASASKEKKKKDKPMDLVDQWILVQG